MFIFHFDCNKIECTVALSFYRSPLRVNRMTLSNHHASYMYWQIEVIGHFILLLDQCFFLIIILSSNYFALVSIIFVHWLQLIYFFTFCLSIDFNSIKNEITHYGVESVPKITFMKSHTFVKRYTIFTWHNLHDTPEWIFRTCCEIQLIFEIAIKCNLNRLIRAAIVFAVVRILLWSVCMYSFASPLNWLMAYWWKPQVKR